MQRGLQSMWSKKPTKRTTLTGIEISEKKKHKSDHEYTTDVITFNKEGVVHKNHPFTEREFDGAFKECGCLPDCACKE
jgi:hypothetical protein